VLIYGSSMRMVDFDYIQCPLGEGQGKCFDLVLIVVKSPRLVRMPATSVSEALRSALKDIPEPKPDQQQQQQGQAVRSQLVKAVRRPPAAASQAVPAPAPVPTSLLTETTKKPQDDAAEYALPSRLLQIFMDVFWRTTVPPSFDYRNDPDFIAMMKQLGQSDFVRVTNGLPWKPPRARL